MFGTDCVNPEDDYSTYVVPLDAASADFPWRDIGRRRSKETRRGEQHDAVYTPQLALTPVATFGDDEGEEAGEYRSDGGWISVSAGRPYVPPHLSLEEATERLRRHMPNVRASQSCGPSPSPPAPRPCCRRHAPRSHASRWARRD